MIKLNKDFKKSILLMLEINSVLFVMKNKKEKEVKTKVG